MSELLLGHDEAGEGWWARFLGELSVSAGFPDNSSSPAFENARIVKAGAGTLFGLSGFNNKASAQFVQVFDANAVPADGAVPQIILSAAAGGNFSYDAGMWGRAFTRGIVICNSSTGPTKTIGSADCWFDAQYV